MKKGIVIAIIALFAAGQTQAQVTFMPGIRVGVNFAHLTKGSDSYSNNYYYSNGPSNEIYTSKTDFYAGVYGAIKLTKYYTLQPEINYSRQGGQIEYTDYSIDSNGQRLKQKLDFGYLTLGVINKFTFGKAVVMVGPSIDFIVDKAGNRNYTAENDLDFAFTAGLGFNFTKNIGIEARIKKGIIPAFTYNNVDHDNVVFQVGLAYSFDIK